MTISYTAILSVAVLSLHLSSTQWPHPIPCRVQDGNNPDLFVMTLGDVNTPIAQAVFYPVEDRVVLKDGTVIEHYYRDHLGIKYYSPIDKTRFPLPPAGWCTWYYYYSRITAEEVKANARWIAENLRDYGARYVQIDDGWQVPPRDWTGVQTGRFPDGMAELASYIRSLGLIPGIWLAPHGQSNEAVVKANPEAFLLKPDQTSASETWEGRFLLDPTTEAAHRYLRDLFERLCKWGYDYFKIDGQPIVVNEYRTKAQFMKGPVGPADELYRNTLVTIRQAIGPDRYLLGCWGIPLEGVGIMNGSRTGGDIVLGWGGFRVALRAVMAYSFLHNIVWYADPDVMVLRWPLTLDQARVWATLQGLTGQALMASDRLMDLGPERVELLRRVYPAVDIRPLDLFGSQREKRIWDLKVCHLGRTYDVVGLFNFDTDRPQQILLSWQDLGLPKDQPMHVFDFWNKEYLGAWEGAIAVDLAPTSCRVLTVLPVTDRVQLISTSRHITQGWVDLVSIDYNDTAMTYRGTSRLIKADPYQLYFVYPRGRNMAVVHVDAGGLPVRISNHQGWSAVTIAPDKTADVAWQVRFEPAGMYIYPPEPPTGLSVKPVGLDGVDLSWSELYWLNAGYRVYLNDQLVGYTPRAAFPLRGLDPKATYQVGVETVWEDGSASRRKAQTSLCIASILPSQMALSQLPARGLSRGPGRGQRDGGTVTIGGRVYVDAILVGPGDGLVYELKGLFSRLVGQVGLAQGDDQTRVILKIFGDGRQISQTEPFSRAEGLKQVEVDVTGVNTLTIQIQTEPPANRRTRAGLLDARLLR